MTHPRRLAVVAFLTAALALAACGKTNRAALEELSPQFALKRQQLSTLAAQLPPPGSVAANMLPPLDPPLVIDRRNKTANAEVLMFDQALDPDVNLRTSNAPDLLLSGELLHCLQWTGPHNPMSERALGERRGADLARGCQSALGYRYLVVLRPTLFRRPVATDPRSYTPGVLALEGFVVDLQANNIRGYFNLNAASDATVRYVYRQGESQQEALDRFAYSTLWENARTQLVQLLQSSGARLDVRSL